MCAWCGGEIGDDCNEGQGAVGWWVGGDNVFHS